MILVQYSHRLPTEYDLNALRKWLKERGTVWDNVPRLFFKAFLVREIGALGTIANDFSSLYLWQQDEAFRDWLVRGGYKVVTDRIGRAQIETFFALESLRGPASDARFLMRSDHLIPLDADLTATLANETELVHQTASQSGVVAASVGLDPLNWKIVRITISQDVVRSSDPSVAYEVVHLAQPLLNELPHTTP